MKVNLMFPGADFDPQANLPDNMADLVQDLEMDGLFLAMSGEDEFLAKIVRPAVLSGLKNNSETVLWRQAVLRDCQAHEEVIRTLYAITLEPVQIKKSLFLISGSRHPSLMLSDGRRSLEGLYNVLKKLYAFAVQEQGTFKSDGLRNLCAMLIDQLNPDYLGEMKQHLATLHFDNGLLFSARLGNGNSGKDFVPRFFVPERWSWLKGLWGDAPAHYRFSIDPRDESGARELADLRDEVLKDIAQSTLQASTHVETFFNILRTELAFYIGCLNLRQVLVSKNCPLCLPEISTTPASLCFEDLRDPSLSLTLDKPAVGNDLAAPSTPLVLITGANQGGKSTFLRSLGLARMMLQAGMFVTARKLSADLRDGVFTHYRRREDRDLNSGKFDEELHRMAQIIEQLGKAPFLLFNESFAATNEREGSEVARQIMTALVEADAQVIFVTHMYALADVFETQTSIHTCFLRADRDETGQRSFHILPGTPQTTSFGRDLYSQIFHEPASSS